MNIQGSFLVCQKKPSRWFFNLRHTLQFGIGLHHVGLNDKDRSMVEELFANNKIQAFLFYLSIGLYQYIGMGCKPSRSILQQLFFRTNLCCNFVIRVLSFVARRRTFVQGNLPNSMVYRNVEQYPNAKQCSWNSEILILEIDAPIYFANNNYLREKHTGWRGLDEGIVVVGTCMI
ncbi:unnamed protein product [Prunus armeniaca]